MLNCQKTMFHTKKISCFLSITLLLYVVLLSTTYLMDTRASSRSRAQQMDLAHRSTLKQVNVSITYHQRLEGKESIYHQRLEGKESTYHQGLEEKEFTYHQGLEEKGSTYQQGLEEQSIFRVLYLVQTEKCLPDYLKSPEVVGNTTACQCDVIVLGYKEKCEDTSLPHVRYIFRQSTTWTTGRNLLYEYSKAKNSFYLYYIFMDDDTTLQVADKSDKNPWRMFEDSLRTIQPPIAVVDPLINFNKTSQPKGCEPQHVTKLVQVFWFDAMFNAFHNQVIHHILPYPTKFDRRSWYYSQMYTIIRCDVKFNGQVVSDTRLKVQNGQHRPYPRATNWNTQFKVVAEDIRNELPDKYRNRSEPILQEWMKDNVRRRLAPGDYYCSRAPNPNTVMPYTPFEDYQLNN